MSRQPPDATAPLLQAVLDAGERAALLRDLVQVARVQAVQLDDGPGTRACGLDEAFLALAEQRVRRVLVRYAYEGRTWFDTLVPDGGNPALTRLVRVAEDDVLAG